MPAFANRPYADIVAVFQKPAHDANRIWTAVVSSRYFKGSFDFESKECARLYLRTQIQRRGCDAFNNERDSVEFRSSFVINRETFEVFSLADLDLAHMRSNPWRKGRNACLTPAEHKARVARVAAYLEARKARSTRAFVKPTPVKVENGFAFQRFNTFEEMTAFALGIAATTEEKVFAESGIYTDNNGLTFRPQVSIVTETVVYVLRWNAFAEQPNIDFMSKRARRDANDESGRLVDIIQTAITQLYTKGTHAMAAQYKIEIEFPYDLGTVSGEYTGREKAIERCRYWLENGAVSAVATSLMTGAVAFKGKARATISANVYADIRGEGFDDAGTLLFPDCPYVDMTEAGAYMEGWNARKARSLRHVLKHGFTEFTRDYSANESLTSSNL